MTKKRAKEEPDQEKAVKRLKQDDDTSNSNSEGEGDVEKRGRIGKSCKTEGCANQAIQGGLCFRFRHGAKAHRNAAVRGARATWFEQVSASSMVQGKA